MSTPSAIIIVTPEGARGIYCHFDGYPSANGVMLRDHYQRRAKVENLVDLGDISSLGEEVAPDLGISHSYENPADGVTVAYMRDRGEEGCETTTGKTAKAVAAQIDAKYIYVFGLDDQWTCDGEPIQAAIDKTTT